MYKLLMIFVAVLTVISCTEDIDSNAEMESHSFMPLKTGNYWVYQVDRIDPIGNITPTTDLDSIHVLSNTFFEGQEYHSVLFVKKSNANQPILKLIRDSVGYLVTSEHEILFSPKNDDEVIHRQELFMPNGDLLLAMDRKMIDIGVTTTTPAGTYTTRNAAGIPTGGTAVNQDCFLRQNRRYAEDIGPVELTDFFASSCHEIRSQLLRYHLEE